MNNESLYIVVPCYNEQEVLPATNATLLSLLDRLVEQQLVSAASRVLYVDDGSTAGTWDVIATLARDDNRVPAVRLAANSGHQNALMAGLAAALQHAHIMVTIDADLQDDSDVIATMIEHYHQGCDVVYGVRRKRKSDSWFKRTTAQTFYRMMHRLDMHSAYNHADFRLMSNRAVAQLMRYRERNLFLRGIVPLLGYRTASVTYDRKARTAGRSKYSLGKMLSFAVDGITSFSIRPVHFVFALGLVFVLIALCMLIYVLTSILMHRTVSGWASLMLSVWFVGGCTLIGLGIVGEYIGKIYIEVKDRPRYNVEQRLGLDDNEIPTDDGKGQQESDT